MSMEIPRGQKINQLLLNWKKGTVKTSSELLSMNISSSLAQSYVRQGWLMRIGKGAYARNGDAITWQGAVYGLQKSGRFVFPGGRTALEMTGVRQYVSHKERCVFLFAMPKSKLPAWFAHGGLPTPMQFTAMSILSAEIQESFSTHHTEDDFCLTVSAPERAVLELLYHVPLKVSFSEAYQIVQGLATLRPALLQELLCACGSIKVKRLFLYMAREAGHWWYSKLTLQGINLGAGKREIVSNGKLDKEFLITVPVDNTMEVEF